MWHWVGGGFSAVAGIAFCLLTILVMEHALVSASVSVYALSLAFRLVMPLTYTLTARYLGFWGETGCVLSSAIYVFVHRRQLFHAEEEPKGADMFSQCMHIPVLEIFL
jgi:hypothetical protein